MKLRHFDFTHIILYSMGLPSSTYGTCVVAAAVLEEVLSDGMLQAAQARYGELNLSCTIQTVVTLVVYRPFSMPASNRYPSGSHTIPGQFKTMKVLFR